MAGQTEFTSPQVSAYLLGITDHYTPTKFSYIHLQTFEHYLVKECDQELLDESVLISSFNNKLTAANLHVDYQFRNTALKNMCLYDYAKGNGRVDRFLFHGTKNNNSQIQLHNNSHPQFETHIQTHRSRGTERVVVLSGKGIPKKKDITNSERYDLSCQEFLNSSTLLSRLKSIINNIELLHRCSEESTLVRELKRNSPILAKVQHTNRFIENFDSDDEFILMNNETKHIFNFDNEHEIKLDSISIVRSGLKDITAVDTAMRYLHIQGKFDIYKFQNEAFMNISLSESEIRISNNYDDKLLKIWQTTISSRKSIFQDNSINYIKLPNTYILPHNNNLPINNELFIQNRNTDCLEKFSIGLNKEQKKAYFLMCDHCQRNQPNVINKPSQLLLYITAAGGTGKTKVVQSVISYFEYTFQHYKIIVLAPTGIAAAIISGYTIHSTCGFDFEDYCKNDATATGDTLRKLQEFWKNIEYVIIDEISMIGKSLLARFHTFLKVAKATDTSAPFAGLNILFSGDFMQLPPVIDPALYVPNKITFLDSLDNLQLFETNEIQFNKINVKDNATYLVTRNDLRVQINFDATRENAQKHNKLLIYSCAEDSYRHRLLHGSSQKKFLSVSDTKENALYGILPLFIGRTYEKAIIDLSNNNAYNSIYVMLSKICKLNDLLILHPFDESLLDIKIPPALDSEIKRLEKCAEHTKKLKIWPDECYNENDIC
ncbi:2590_t:CDS:2 [Cetraspora pellucida]|uniref:ATP-dependent DNA helicase n=1 Tax=Cetraspora pellucida TaxID=1433469 RepID=A0A9N9GFK1_9GLOM|nr:2590_t:CDS:2 [Cetraspora pellucida]